MKLKSVLKPAALILSALLTTALLVAFSGDSQEESTRHRHGESGEKQPAAVFHDNMRILWEDHIAWTRLAIISIAADLPDAASTTARLLQNQTDIGNAIKPYYGAPAGEGLTALLNDHIVIAAELVAAARDGDSAAVADAKSRWYANADAIAGFLSSANPGNWQLAEMQAMMREHLDLTLQEAVSYLTGGYEASVAAYDRIHGQILHMADMLSDGIIAQFPATFSTNSGGR